MPQSISTISRDLASSQTPSSKKGRLGTLGHRKIEQDAGKKPAYLNRLIHVLGEQNSSLIEESLKKNFGAFKEEFEVEFKGERTAVCLNVFKLFLERKTNLEQSKITRDRLKDATEKEKLTKLINEREKQLKSIENSLQKINKDGEKGVNVRINTLGILQHLQALPIIELENHDYFTHELLKLQSADAPTKKRFLAEVIAWLRQIIITLIRKAFLSPKEIFIAEFKDNLKNSQETANKISQDILRSCLLADENSDLFRGLGLPKSTKESILKGAQEQVYNVDKKDCREDIGRAILVFEATDTSEKLTIENTGTATEEDKDTVFERTTTLATKPNSATEFLLYRLLGQAGMGEITEQILFKENNDKTLILSPSTNLAPFRWTVTEEETTIHCTIQGTLGLKITEEGSNSPVATFTIHHTINNQNPHNPTLSTTVTVEDIKLPSC